MRRLVMAMLMIFTLTGMIFGQSAPLTLEDCIQIALRDNSTILINRNQNESIREDVTGSYAGILPSINMTASTGKAKAGARETEQDVPIGVRPDSSYIYGRRVITQPGYETNFNNFGLSVNQNIFDGGEWWNAISYAKSERQVSDRNLSTVVNNVILDVEQKFYDLLKAQKLLEVNDLAVQRSEDQLNKTQKMFELGAVAKVDVYRSKVNLGNDKITQLLQKNAVVAARQNLNLAMGKDPKAPLEIKPDFEIKSEYTQVDTLIARGLANNPEVQKNEAMVNSSSLQVSRSYGVLWPSLRLFFNYNRSNEAFNRVWSYDGLDKNWSTNYGVSLSLNLFNGLRDKTRIQKAKLQERNAQETYEQSKRNLRGQINQLVEDYNSYLEIITINESNLEAAQEEYRLAEERYRIGSGTQLEVREAQVNLTRAEDTLVRAKYSALVAQAQLQNALGIIVAANSEAGE